MTTFSDDTLRQIHAIDLRAHISKNGHPMPPQGLIKCMFHEEKDGSFSVYTGDDGKPRWKCFGACATGGDIIDWEQKKFGLDYAGAIQLLAEEYHIPINNNGHSLTPAVDLTAAPADGKLPEYTSAAEYAKKHGLQWYLLEAQGWQEITVRGEKALRIPSSDGNPRIRLLSSKRFWREREGEGAICWYAFPGTRKIGEALETVAPMVVLCNGQISVEVARHYGLQAFCFTDGEKAIPEHLLPDLTKLLETTPGLQLIVALDNDKQGQSSAAKIVNQLSVYRERVKVADFAGKKEHYDLADFVMEHQNNTAADFPAICKLPTLPASEQSAQLVSGKIALQKSIARWQKSITDGKPDYTFQTGITRIDAALQGLTPGAMYLFAADTGVGKTTLMASLAANLIFQAPGLIISFEINEERFTDRLLAYYAHVPYGYIPRGGHYDYNDMRWLPLTAQQNEAIRNAQTKLQSAMDYQFLGQADTSTPGAIEQSVTNAITGHAIKWLIFDSMDGTRLSANSGIYEDTRATALVIEALARRTDLLILATCQTGRHTQLGDAPKLHDTYGGSPLESKAHAALAIYDPDAAKLLPEQVNQPRKLQLRINKNRDGETTKNIPIWFRPGIGFYNIQSGTPTAKPLPNLRAEFSAKSEDK